MLIYNIDTIYYRVYIYKNTVITSDICYYYALYKYHIVVYYTHNKYTSIIVYSTLNLSGKVDPDQLIWEIILLFVESSSLVQSVQIDVHCEQLLYLRIT